jgi:hypothetical protein
MLRLVWVAELVIEKFCRHAGRTAAASVGRWWQDILNVKIDDLGRVHYEADMLLDMCTENHHIDIPVIVVG